MENKNEKQVEKALVTIDFNNIKKERQTIQAEFNGVQFEIEPEISYDRFVTISKTLLDSMREDVSTGKLFVLSELDVYALVAYFKRFIITFYTNVDSDDYEYTVLEESGFVDYVLSKITNYTELYNLFLTEISILNVQLTIFQLTNSMPTAEDTATQMTDVMSELSDSQKELLELVLGKKIKDEIRSEVKAENAKQKVQLKTLLNDKKPKKAKKS